MNKSVFRDAFVIARRELLERIRSKWFVIVTLLGPVGMFAMVAIPALIARSGSAGTVVEIVDETAACVTKTKEPCDLGRPLALALEGAAWTVRIVDPKTTDAELLDRVRTKDINGFIKIPADALESGEILYQGDNASAQAVQLELRKNVEGVVRFQRGRSLSLGGEQLVYLLGPVNVGTKHTTGAAEGASGIATFLVGYILAFILYIVITLYGVNVMRSVVQEKTSRVMEMMVSAVKPDSMMAGKILGVGAAGLIQMTVWLGMGAITLTYRDTITGWFGAAGGGPSALPPLAGAELAVVIAYFIVGFFFYASMYAAVGAMVSSEQDTQHVQMPVTLALVIGIMLLQVIGNDPRSGGAGILTMIPIWSPILMPMRYVLGGATLGDVLLSLAILVVSTAIVIHMAAKIYRAGVLMYGKRPSLHELLRWLRY
ncbi:MAG: ABC transporter permease [Deltaproteobacteria bacterium]|nr:ABC transporter permease [Deltaproteobacteria bacterium]